MIDKDKQGPWSAELDERRRRQEFAEELGGFASIEYQHRSGRRTCRERIALLLDDSSFQEIGAMVGGAKHDESGRLEDVRPASIVIGKGRIAGRDVVVSADDFTIRGGSSEVNSTEKWEYAERLALSYRMPLVRLVETAGGSINLLEKMGATKIPGYPHWPVTEMLGKIPVVGIAMGPCAGFGAVRVIMSHFSVMVKGTSQVFAAGPAVVGPGVGEEIDKEALGGSAVHAHGTGVVDNEAEDETDALEQAKRFLSYLPSNAFEWPTAQSSDDSTERRDEELLQIVPENRRRVYKMRTIIKSVLDAKSIFEIGRYWGRSEITALGRLDGHPVGILANDPQVWGGALTDVAAEKMTRFIDVCDTFHIPIINLVDQPGVTVGSEAERRGTVRKAIRLQCAIDQTSVPWLAIFVRRSFGVAGAAYGPLNTVVRVAWPSAYWGSIPVEGGVEAAYKRDIASAHDPKARRDELVSHFRPLESPFKTAERFGIEDIIDPRETRPLACRWVREAYRRMRFDTPGIRPRTMRV